MRCPLCEPIGLGAAGSLLLLQSEFLDRGRHVVERLLDHAAELIGSTIAAIDPAFSIMLRYLRAYYDRR